MLSNNLSALPPNRSHRSYLMQGNRLVILRSFMKRSRCVLLLGLSHTTTRPVFGERCNIAEPYAALEDGSPYHLQCRQNFEGTFSEAAGGVYSNVDDLLKWGKAIIRASQVSGSSETSPLKQIPMLLSNHIGIMKPSLMERSYGMGWARTQFPGIVGLVEDNVDIMPLEELPILGKGSHSRLVIYHQGDTVGYYPAIYLDPRTETVIVVLTNSMAIGDAADWISQAIGQTLFEPWEPINYLEHAVKIKDALLDHYSNLQDNITQGRNTTTRRRPLESYIGRYLNHLGNFLIEIQRDPNKNNSLVMVFQGEKRHRFELRHYRNDTFEWSLKFNETAKRGGYHIWNAEYFEIRFKFDNGPHPRPLIWKEDPCVKQGNEFVRQEPPKSWWSWNWVFGD